MMPQVKIIGQEGFYPKNFTIQQVKSHFLSVPVEEQSNNGNVALNYDYRSIGLERASRFSYSNGCSKTLWHILKSRCYCSGERGKKHTLLNLLYFPQQLASFMHELLMKSKNPR